MPLSVIIPTLNEAAHIGRAIASLRRQGACEIIVADGGSSDDTLVAARQADLVLSAERSRAAQMNAGASHATGDILLFLHADGWLAPGGLAAAARSLNDARVAAACFSLRVQAEGWPYRLIDAAAAARVRLTGIIYGDQGLAVRRTDFERIGGFPCLRFMEDIFISRRLRRLGRMAVLPQRVHVSARRWRAHGLVRQTLRNWTLTALAFAGVHPDRLANFYQ